VFPNIPADSGFLSPEEIREQSRREGVACADNFSFYLEPNPPADAAVLLIHGFCATPWEMRALGDALVSAGFAAAGIRLPGHGTTPEDLAGRRYEEWLKAAAAGYRLLAGRHRRVYGAGVSTGALLLLALCAQMPLQGLALLSPYLRLRHKLAPAAVVLRFFKPFYRREISAEPSPYYYDRFPTNGVYQLSRLIRRVRRIVNRVCPPLLVISGAGDRTVRTDSALELFRRIPSSRKEYHLFGTDVPHVLTTSENPRQKEILQLTVDFFRNLENTQPRLSSGEKGP
jgi:carboxylesterase